ncbi:MAG: glutamine amidotransferase [Acidobacteriia bacterium]|nr:glutamine amidotransferase [Terriglobia bacterium]
MSKDAAYLFIFDGFADWEPAFAVAELRRSFGFATQTLAATREPVVSMGGLRVVPDGTLSELDPGAASILILPGGDSWLKGEQPAVTPALRSMAAAHRPVAGICAATLALAHAGLLDDRLHTSNGRGFIERHVPGYRGANSYRALPAISDRDVITASGLAPVAFAVEIFRRLAPASAQDIAVYEALYSRGFVAEFRELETAFSR